VLDVKPVLTSIRDRLLIPQFPGRGGERGQATHRPPLNIITYFFGNYFDVYMSKDLEEKKNICDFLNQFLLENNINYDNSLVQYFVSKHELYSEIKSLLIEENYFVKNNSLNTFYIFSINKMLYKINKTDGNYINGILNEYKLESEGIYLSYDNQLKYDNYCDLVFKLNRSHISSTKKKVYKVTRTIKIRKKYISKGLKEKIWLKNFGSNFEVNCPCCEIRKINPFSFSTGHIEAESKGGENNISNLRPICCHCNSRMGTMNYYDYKNRIS
jgi:hypothetical protein